jgi:hypothetical protein
MKTPFERALRCAPPAASIALVVTCAACSTTGTAVGELEQPGSKREEAVTFVWKSDASDPDRGKISGTLPDGTHYSGRYFEVVKTAEADIYGAAWDGWRPYWSGWHPGWYSGPRADFDWPTFVEIYTGRVIANLKSDDQKVQLRCRFAIDNPRAGLIGGGTGDCQLSNGAAIDHVIVAAN